jgi:TIR domain
MRIFLSFASEQESVAETILLALCDRGHSVFFSKDDMPPGESYDARIRKAVLASDLMIFLISPQSVTRGRYTMTELAFARQRWPNPSGRLLPVLVAPTLLNTIPAYLKAATILEPLGNIAAETSAQVDTWPSKSHHLAILGFGLLGIATALGSYGSVVLFPPRVGAI